MMKLNTLLLSVGTVATIAGVAYVGLSPDQNTSTTTTPYLADEYEKAPNVGAPTVAAPVYDDPSVDPSNDGSSGSQTDPIYADPSIDRSNDGSGGSLNAPPTEQNTQVYTGDASNDGSSGNRMPSPRVIVPINDPVRRAPPGNTPPSVDPPGDTITPPVSDNDQPTNPPVFLPGGTEQPVDYVKSPGNTIDPPDFEETRPRTPTDPADPSVYQPGETQTPTLPPRKTYPPRGTVDPPVNTIDPPTQPLSSASSKLNSTRLNAQRYTAAATNVSKTDDNSDRELTGKPSSISGQNR